MSCRFYMDVHVPWPITESLRRRGVDVLTAQEDGNHRLPDTQLLTRAGSLVRAVFTQDQDFLVEAARRQRAGEHFAGVVFGAQRRTTISGCIADLELIAVAMETEELRDRVIFLPL